MNLSELHPSWIISWLTVMLIGITAWYLWLLMLPLKQSRKMRETELIRKKLDRFYFPLKKALLSVEEDHIERSSIKPKATVLNNAIKEVLNYHNLSSSELRPLIRRFSKTYHCYDCYSDFDEDSRNVYNETVDSIDRIEALITRDIIDYSIKLDKLTH